MDTKVSSFLTNIIRHLEYILAISVIIAVVIAFINGVTALSDMNWQDTDTFYEMIRYVLALVIGLEFVRMLITHKLNVVLELLAFVIARKLLLPNLSALDIVLSVIAFVILMTARHFMFKDDVVIEQEEPVTPF